MELAGSIRRAYGRVQDLCRQELEEFRNWVRCILLSVCGDKMAVVEEIMSWAGNGEDDMAFKYNIVRMFEEERAEGRAEAILDLLQNIGAIPESLQKTILVQKDEETLRGWLKLASTSRTIEEFESSISEM